MSSSDFADGYIFCATRGLPTQKKTAKIQHMELPDDKRRQLCEQLLTYIARTPARARVATQVLDFVLHTPDCFERSHTAGHITGSAWVVSPDGEKALLTLHRKLRLWVQPGGHADGDPDILRVALREALEETGIKGLTPLCPDIYDIDIHLIPARPQSGDPEHLHYDVRYLLQAPHEQYVISDESDALGWFTEHDLNHLTPPADDAVRRLATLWPITKERLQTQFDAKQA